MTKERQDWDVIKVKTSAHWWEVFIASEPKNPSWVCRFYTNCDKTAKRLKKEKQVTVESGGYWCDIESVRLYFVGTTETVPTLHKQTKTPASPFTSRDCGVRS